MRVYFIGIGGIGVSALARYFLARGDEVSGSDIAKNDTIEELRAAGARIISGCFEYGERNPELIIYSAAVPENNLELTEARRRGVNCRKYAQALGDLTREKFTIAISGMHGKSTVTAMVGLIMERAGLDPTVIVGAKAKWRNHDGSESCGNFRAGQSQYLVVEADEYDRSFLNYRSQILVLLNIEEEHLDTYSGGLSDIMKTFGEYVSHLPADGTLVANGEDKNVGEICRTTDVKCLKYDLGLGVANLKLKIPGRHNLNNAAAALAVAQVLNIDKKIAVDALSDFRGVGRRMEYKGIINGAAIYDDYGHHPTEIAATLEGAKTLLASNGRLWCVFQPHQYQRTRDLFDKFLGAFDAADEIILLPIYSVAGREKEEIKEKISSEKLAAALGERLANDGQKRISFFDSFDGAANYLRENLQGGDVCVIMGAGDIYRLTEKLV